MKYIHSFYIALLLLLPALSFAQNEEPYFNDEIIIAYQDSVQIRIQVDNFGKPERFISLAYCHQKFLDLFTTMEASLPSDKQLLITYEYGKLLKAHPLKEEEVFYVNEDEALQLKSYTSKLIMTGRSYRVVIEFDELEQIKDPKIQKAINFCMEDLPKRSIHPSTVNFIYRNDTIIKPENHMVKHGDIIDELGMFLGAHFGFAAGLPSYGVSAGWGYMHKVKNVNSSFYYLGVSTTLTYNSDTKKEEGLSFLTLGVKFQPDMQSYNFNWVGIEAGVTLGEYKTYFDNKIYWMIGFSYQLNDHLWLKTDIYQIHNEKKGIGFTGLSFGF